MTIPTANYGYIMPFVTSKRWNSILYMYNYT